MYLYVQTYNTIYLSADKWCLQEKKIASQDRMRHQDQVETPKKFVKMHKMKAGSKMENSFTPKSLS